ARTIRSTDIVYCLLRNSLQRGNVHNRRFEVSEMQNEYTVHVDSKGYVLIPAEVRKEMGIHPKSILILTVHGEELKLVPGEAVPRRRVRKIPREELAQALIDGADTATGIDDAKQGIRDLGLNPEDFKSKF